MSHKRPFDHMLERVTKTIDKNYSNQKSSYKGWAAFFKVFGQITQEYSDSLQKLSKDGGDHLGLKAPLPDCVKYENVTIKSIMSEMLFAIASLSNLHHNFSERLIEMSETYSQLYEGVRKTKDHFMESLQSTYPKQLSRAGNSREGVERKLTKTLHSMSERLEQDELGRVQHMRENSIMIYTMYKKIAQKESELMQTNGGRLSRLEVESSNKDLSQMTNDLIDFYNDYPGEDKLQKKAQKMTSSLRDSLRMTKINSKQLKQIRSKDHLKELVRQAESQEAQLFPELNTKYELKKGFLSKALERYYDLGCLINPGILSHISFSLLQSFYYDRREEEDMKKHLKTIKARLRLSDYKHIAHRSHNFNDFVRFQFQHRPEIQKLNTIIITLLGGYYSGWITQSQMYSMLEEVLKKSVLTEEDLPREEVELDIWVCSCIVDILLQVMFQARQDQEFLISEYNEIFNILKPFSSQYLKIDNALALVLFLDRIWRNNEYRLQNQIEPACDNLYEIFTEDERQGRQASDLAIYMRGCLRNKIYRYLLHLYKPSTRTHLAIRQLKLLDLAFRAENTLEDILRCVKLSGWHYLQEKCADRSLFGLLHDDRQRIPLLSQSLQNCQFYLIDEKILSSLATTLSDNYSCGGQEAVRQRLRQNFIQTTIDTVLYNLEAVDVKTLEDKDGHLLRLGMELCKIDNLCPQQLSRYDETFFKVLTVGVASLEAEYRSLLEQVKSTEMWIIEQNMFATQNCYDFCCLLAKPIEFMGSILKETKSTGNIPSAFRDKFVHTIKMKLNQILETEVLKYFSFLELTLRKIECEESKVSIEPRKIENIQPVNTEQLTKNYSSYRQVCKRLNNLLFIKQQVNEIVKELIQTETQDKIKNDIYNFQDIEKEISRQGKTAQSDLLVIIKNIASKILSYEMKIKYKVAKSLPFLYLRKFFERLYWKPEKNAFEELFKGHHEVKLPEFSLISMRQELEDYIQLVERCVPKDYLKDFYEIFFSSLATATRCQILNGNKLRLPLPPEEIYNFVNSDASNMATIFKKLTQQEQIVSRFYLGQLRRVVDMLKQDVGQLQTAFQSAFISKRMQEAEQLLSAINLRCQQKDKRSKEFVKKYKTSFVR